jgi:hypothetical protein
VGKVKIVLREQDGRAIGSARLRCRECDVGGKAVVSGVRLLAAGEGAHAVSLEPLPLVCRRLGASGIRVEVGGPKKKLFSHLGRSRMPQ